MLITSYYQKGEINEALRVFNDMPVKDIVSWNSMIKGCLSCGDLDMARKLFDEMPGRNVVSWTTIVDGCAQFGEVEMAEELFGKMPWRDIAAWNSMVFGYCSNGRIEDGFELFKRMPRRDDISWTTMIGGLGQCGRSEEALFLFQEMCVLGVKPTPSTYSSVLTACANISALCCGVQLHALVVKIGYVFDTFISASLITFYAHCTLVDNSLKVFEDNLVANVVMWTALITGYGLNSKHEEALEVFYGMIMSGTMPNQFTFASALKSCSELDALDRGKGLHTRTIKLGLDVDVFVGNSLIVMYTECGCVGDGITIFNNMKVPPDEITYVGLLTACSHCRMLDKGKYFFEKLNWDPSVEVKLEHYACMVDILGAIWKVGGGRGVYLEDACESRIYSVDSIT
ncbi:hypothetical protein IFM89_020025 [Coptis chinensis]|uniref:Pentatricopeptide repeat-containing protein n=1 Tax=Coptis chinensis TaxID=261450 RepID=A0A835IPF2_9MAGN|nr:hypothetical protein IFM89_020025 [Coptis chinensis]